MTTGAKTAHGTQVQYGDAATPETFLTVAEVIEIDPAEESAEPLDATSHDTTAKEFIPGGLTDSGEIAFTVNLTGGATQTAVHAKLGTAAANWQVCFPNFGERTKTFTAVAATDICTAAAHGLTTGQPVRVTSTTTLPAGLTAGVTYYAHWLSADTFTLHTTNAGAVADTGVVDITDTGTGTHTLQIGTKSSFAAIVKTDKLGADRGSLLTERWTAKITAAITTV